MIRLVLADDHGIVLGGLVSLFGACADFEVVGEARNGREALRLIESQRPDIAVLDISMPAPDGIEVAGLCQKRGWDTKTVLLTMHKDRMLAKRAMTCGVVGYVVKDDNFEDLVQALRIVSNGGSYLSPSIVAEVLSDLGDLGMSLEQPVSLTAREIEVISLLGQGLTSRQIAEMVGLSRKTVESHRSRIMQKLNTHTTAELIRLAVKQGWI